MKVTATATRSGNWWAVEIADAPGGPFHTQTRRLDQVEAMVKDGVALMAGVPGEAIEVTVLPKLPQEDAELIDAACAASQEAVRAAERASRLSRQAVERLRSAGMTVRDVGGLLGVSPQRVCQLVETGTASTRGSRSSGRSYPDTRDGVESHKSEGVEPHKSEDGKRRRR